MPTPPTRPEPDDAAVADLVALIGDRWSILLVRALLRGLRRFDELRDDLGISRPVLSDRLRTLTRAGIVERTAYQEHPPRYEYRLTAMGVDLSPMIVALMRWGSQWLGADGPRTVLVHKTCGTELDQKFWCSHCRTTFGPNAVAARTP